MEPNGAKEQVAAKLLLKMEQVGDLLGQLPSFSDRIKAVEENLGKLNVKAVLDEFEKLKAGHEAIVEQLRRSRQGLYFPGLEDAKFSLSNGIAILAFGYEWLKSQGYKVDREYEVMRNATAVYKAQQGGDDAKGGLFIPDQALAGYNAALYAESEFIALDGATGRTRVTVLPNLTGGSVSLNRFLGGVKTYWVGEKQAPPESEALDDQIVLKPHKMAQLVIVTDFLKRMGDPGYDAFLQQDMTGSAAEMLDFVVPYGAGSAHQPRGIMKTDGIKVYSAQSKKTGVKGVDALDGAKFQANWIGGEFGFDNMSDMKLALVNDKVKPNAASAWVSSPALFDRLKRLKVEQYPAQPASDGRIYVLGDPMLSDARLAERIGPYGETPQIPFANKPGASISAPTTSTETKFTDVIYGRLNEVIVGTWAGMTIENDNGKGVYFANDQTQIKLRREIDIQVRQPRAIIVCPDARAAS
jgi:HK97 family phage major capsid protein